MWLVQQGQEIGDYYLEDESEDPIEDYFHDRSIMSVKNLVLRSNNLQKKWRSLQTEMGSAIAGTGSLISTGTWNPWEKSRLSTDWCMSSR